MNFGLEYLFMQRALIALILLSPTLGLLGTLVVQNRWSFFSDAIGHSALTGLALGNIFATLWTWTNGNSTSINSTDITVAPWIVTLGMLGFGVLFAALMTLLKHRSHQDKANNNDVLISVLSSISLSIGIVFLSQEGNYKKYSSFLIGNLLTITESDLWSLGFLLLLVLLFWLVCFNSFFLATTNPSWARLRGIPTIKLELLFTSLLAVVVTFAIQWVGILLINALLIIPAATAKNFAHHQRQFHLASVLIALICGICGLFLSYHWDLSSGALIVLLLGVFFLISTFKN